MASTETVNGEVKTGTCEEGRPQVRISGSTAGVVQDRANGTQKDQQKADHSGSANGPGRPLPRTWRGREWGEEGVEYRRIPSHPKYAAGSDGSIWSFHAWLPYKMTLTRKPSGHLIIFITRVGQRFVHRLVLEAFIGPRPEGMICCHYDGNPQNNKPENLRWDTHYGNAQDAIRHRRIRAGL